LSSGIVYVAGGEMVQSPDNTLVGYGQAITDAQGNVWTITANGQVAVNRVPDPTTANVTHLAYANGLVWQENTADLWWSKTSPGASWNPPDGTPVVPVPVNASPDNTLLTAGAGNAPSAITDASGNTWTIMNGQVVVNGVADQTTANVTHLAYVNGVIWQENTNDLWWSKTSPASSWNPPNGSSTVPVPIYASPDDSILGAPMAGSLSAITDQSGNRWSIAGGQVIVNGVADPTSANVIQLAYVGGKIWQENNQGLWWYKTAPANGWSGGNGIAASPIGATWDVVNNPFDQATIYVGKVTVQEPTVPPNALAAVVTTGFEANGTAIGISASNAEIVINGNSSLTNGATLTLIGQYRTRGPVYSNTENNGTMTVNASTAHFGALSGTGSINAANGSSLDVQSSAAGETIKLQSSHLTIGGQGNFGGSGPAGGMSFLASIKMNNSPASSITLANTQATSMVLSESGGAIHEVFLYNGSAEVADLKLSGPSELYAEQHMSGSTPYVELVTQPVNNALPMTIHS
jgi:sugar lactone lactonase YvrE